MNRCDKERRTGFGAISLAVAWAGLFALFTSSCQTHESGLSGEGQAQAVRRSTGVRLDESVLSNVGLETLWFNPPEVGEHPVSGVYLLDEGVFLATLPVRSVPGRLQMLSRNDGMAVWYYDLDGPLRTAPSSFRYPTRGPGTYNELYVVLNDTVHCIGLEHGDLLWKRPASFTISTSVEADEHRYFAGSENGRVYGVLKNQSIDDWTYLTGDYIEANPVVGRPNVYVASTDGGLYKFSNSSGDLSWQFHTGARVTSSPVLFAQWVLVGSADYKLYCLNVNDGSVAWTFLAEAPILDSPVVYSFRAGQEFAYCIATQKKRQGEKRTLFSVRMRGGQEQWRVEGVRKVVSIGARNLYVLTDSSSGGERALLAIDVLTGVEQFRLPVDRRFRFIPTNLSDYGRSRERGRLYLVGSDGSVQAIGER